MIIPARYYEELAPEARDMFLRYAPLLYDGTVAFNMPESELHAMAHCERVLFHALAVGASELGADDREGLEILAQAAVFHDTRRQDEYLDTGHGARAAVYYEDFCSDPESPLSLHPETSLLMRYHDLDDTLGMAAIDKNFPPGKTDRTKKLYAIFKDADALDRWRLGRHGLDPKFLRTASARARIGLAREIVADTMDAEVLARYDRLLDEIVRKNNGLYKE